MIAAGGKGIRQPRVESRTLVHDLRRLAVHQSLRAHDSAAINLDERLMPEADAEHRYLAGESADHVLRNARLGRDARSRGDAQVGRLDLARGLDRDLVVTMHTHVRAEHEEGLHQVVSKGIVVVDKKQTRGHFSLWLPTAGLKLVAGAERDALQAERTQGVKAGRIATIKTIDVLVFQPHQPTLTRTIRQPGTEKWNGFAGLLYR